MLLFESERLRYRNLTPGDAHAFFELNADPQVIQYTGDPPFESEAAARAFLVGYDHYQHYGYGRWAVENKETGAFIGWCGLKYDPAKQETDLGYRFFRTCWGKGFASEAAEASMQYGWENWPIQRVVGRAMRDNTASWKVLEKVGMHFVSAIDFEGKPGVLYAINRPSGV
ncbi:MAG: GNAT family N-acetyltransferase [Saprospiraceae bacterium]